MTSVDTNVNLVINQLTEAQYLQLSSQGMIDDNQLYLIPDEIDYYKKSETSSNVQLDDKFDSYYDKNEVDTKIGPASILSDYVETEVTAEDEDGSTFQFVILTKGFPI